MNKFYIATKYGISIFLTATAAYKFYKAEIHGKKKNYSKACYEMSWAAVALIMLMMVQEL